MAGYKTALGNARNGTNSAWPTMWRTATHEYCLVTRVDWHLLVCQRSLSGGPWTSFDVSGTDIGIIEVSDSHYAAVIAVDAQGYIHISGNMHQIGMRYIRSENPNDITSWVTGVMPVNWVTSGANYSTYQSYEVFSDGTLLWCQDQSDALTTIGRDQTMWRLGPEPGATWQPCVGTGEIMTTPNGSDGNVANVDEIPDRAYLHHAFVDAADVLHCVYVWRMEDSDGSSMGEQFYVRSHDKGTSWENVLGEAVTAPFTYRTTLDGVSGVGAAAVTVDGNPVGGAVAGGRCIDADGNFHYIVWGSGSPTGHDHIWWNGSAWQKEQIIGYASPTAATLTLVRDDLWLWNYRNTSGLEGYYGSNLTQKSTPGTKFQIRVGNCPPPGTPDGVYTFESSATYSPAPIHAGGLIEGRHVTRFAIPDGDSPRTFSFGDGPRHRIPAN